MEEKQYGVREFSVYMSLLQKIKFQFGIALTQLHRGKMKFFDTTTKRSIDWAEYTPYNKGCLIKLRVFMNHFEVWYGVKKVVYCSTLLSALAEIKILKEK